MEKVSTLYDDTAEVACHMAIWLNIILSLWDHNNLEVCTIKSHVFNEDWDSEMCRVKYASPNGNLILAPAHYQDTIMGAMSALY